MKTHDGLDRQARLTVQRLVGMPTSEGQRILQEAAKAKGAKAAIARAIGRSKMTITSLARGDYEPGRETALALRDHLGIPIEAWGEKPKRNGRAA